ncbi:DUF3606 domain-containing protein [Tahibacter amnicola]|uniref:DUF3606 domain-containing protein n=1 Tax=Tahibacter amnicola TaxID=2976241 RepID=A0ABY6BJN0_9GAMM|nr:DUF3606 domain-containing protein [Tahibacter amnicola]UXI70221.1 DUF3606 domain-containing protein [Tahibacter amnicola]
MADPSLDTAKPDDERIVVDAEHDEHYWTQALGITDRQLWRAVFCDLVEAAKQQTRQA